MTGTTIPTARCRHRLEARRHTARQRRARWDMAWNAPPFADLFVRGVAYGMAAGAVAGTPVFPVIGTVLGAWLGMLGSVLVAPVVALVLRRDDGRAVGTALLHAEIAAVLATLVAFVGPVAWFLHVDLQHDGFFTFVVAATLVAAWCSARVLVMRAFRRSLGGSPR